MIAPARWHSLSLPLVYLAETPSGALLEQLVHLIPENWKLPKTYSMIKISVPEGLAPYELEPGRKDGWKDDPEFTQQLGNEWLRDAKTALARVPSVIVGDTWNILLNPRHPDAANVAILSVNREPFDMRLFHSGHP